MLDKDYNIINIINDNYDKEYKTIGCNVDIEADTDLAIYYIDNGENNYEYYVTTLFNMRESDRITDKIGLFNLALINYDSSYIHRPYEYIEHFDDATLEFLDYMEKREIYENDGRYYYCDTLGINETRGLSYFVSTDNRQSIEKIANNKMMIAGSYAYLDETNEIPKKEMAMAFKTENTKSATIGETTQSQISQIIDNVWAAKREDTNGGTKNSIGAPSAQDIYDYGQTTFDIYDWAGEYSIGTEDEIFNEAMRKAADRYDITIDEAKELYNSYRYDE